MASRAEDKILLDKKIKFELEVEKAAEELKVKTPKVVFYKTREHFNNGERAHIHVELNTICISEPELQIMSYDDLRTTATHEVSHIHHKDHDEEFHQMQNEAETSLWRPPSGVTHIVHRNQNEESKMIKSRRDNKWKNYCQYYSCKKKSSLTKCPYCKEKFCSQHLTPREAKVGYSTEKYENSHPCFQYSKKVDEDAERKDAEYRSALDKVIKGAGKMPKEQTEGYFNPDKSSSKLWECEYCGEDFYTKKAARLHEKSFHLNKKKNQPLWKGIILVLLTLVLAYLAYANFDLIKSKISFNQKTEPVITSILDNQTLEAFSYINNYRTIASSSELIYDERLYEWVKAVADSRDVNPEAIETSEEFNELIKSKVDTSKFSSSYYISYFIAGKGLPEFLRQFNSNFNARAIIRDAKYDYGAIYCGLDFCILFIYEKKY